MPIGLRELRQRAVVLLSDPHAATIASRRNIVKKLRLEDIQVESYQTNAAPHPRGTVQANAITDLCNTFKCPTNVGSCETNQFCC